MMILDQFRQIKAFRSPLLLHVRMAASYLGRLHGVVYLLASSHGRAYLPGRHLRSHYTSFSPFHLLPAAAIPPPVPMSFSRHGEIVQSRSHLQASRTTQADYSMLHSPRYVHIHTGLRFSNMDKMFRP